MATSGGGGFGVSVHCFQLQREVCPAMGDGCPWALHHGAGGVRSHFAAGLKETP